MPCKGFWVIIAAAMETVVSGLRMTARCLVKGVFTKSTLTNASAAAATKLVHITQTIHTRQFNSLKTRNVVSTVTLAFHMKNKPRKEAPKTGMHICPFHFPLESLAFPKPEFFRCISSFNNHTLFQSKTRY